MVLLNYDVCLHNCVHDARLTAIICNRRMVERFSESKYSAFIRALHIGLTISLNWDLKILKFLILVKAYNNRVIMYMQSHYFIKSLNGNA